MEEAKKYDPDMRGALYEDTENKGKDKYPCATGTITVSGVELRIAMWPSQVSKNGKKYWPLKVEYKQGARFMLAKVNPANVIVTGATATPEATTTDAAGDVEKVDDMPF